MEEEGDFGESQMMEPDSTVDDIQPQPLQPLQPQQQLQPDNASVKESRRGTQSTKSRPRGESRAMSKSSKVPSKIESKQDSKLEQDKHEHDSKSETASLLSSKQQHLFLIEFLVDSVCIDTCSVDEEVLEGQTCLTFTFFNFPPMEVCEKDFDRNKESGSEKVRFNCGKSLMFAFTEKQCEHPPPLSADIVVSKKIGEDENMCKVDIGTIKICITEIFRQIVDIARFKPDKLPASKAIKDCFMLIGPGKRTMGQICVYIRLSCLGQNVVTEFQCGPDLKKSPVLFKNREGKKVFQFSGNDSQEDLDNQAASSKGFTCPPCPQPMSRGGQGDAGKTSPNASRKGNVQDRTIRCQNVERFRAPNKAGDCDGKARTKGGMAVSQVNSDPDKNCFVLRVGDKGQIPDRGKMILEFKTPKQKIIPKIIPPYHEDIAVQTDSAKKKKGKKRK